MSLPAVWPVFVGWAAMFAYAAYAYAGARLSARGAHTVLSLGWLLHAVALASELGLLGAPPSFGFAPALSVTAWLALTVYWIESRVYPELSGLGALALMSAVTVLLMAIFPGSPLRVGASAWMPLHLAMGVACSGLFAAAMVHGWAMNRAEKLMRQATNRYTGLPLMTLERLTFRFVFAGFVLLSATLVAGWWFGEVLQGANYVFKWDHKVVLSMLAWLTFAVLLVGRARFGWRGRPAVRLLYTGSALLLLAYPGSRFVMEVVLGRSA